MLWLDRQGRQLAGLRPAGSGKSHLAVAIGHALVEAGYRVLLTRTIARRQVARSIREPAAMNDRGRRPRPAPAGGAARTRPCFVRRRNIRLRRRRRQQADAGEAAIAKLDKYHLLILDDFCYARKHQAETGVLFELIAARYERRSLLVTANKPFGAASARLLRAVPAESDRSSADDRWNEVFPDPSRR